MKHQHILAVTALTIALLSACGTTQPTLVQAPQNLTTGFQAAPSNGGRLRALAAGAWETTRFATGVDDLTSSTWTKVTGLNVTANALANTVDSFDTQLDKLTHTGTDTKYANTRLNINAGETIDVSVMVAGSGVAQVWLQNTNDWSSISSKNITLTGTPQRVLFTNVVKPTGANNNIQLVIGDIQSSETVYVGGARTRASDTGTTGGTGGTTTPITVAALSSWTKGTGVSIVDNNDTFQKITTTNASYVNTPVSVVIGQTYRYTAKVKGVGTLQLFFQQRGSAYTQYASKVVDLTSVPTDISFDVQIPNSGAPAQIGIGDLNTNETFYVQNPKLELVSPTNTTSPNAGGPSASLQIKSIFATKVAASQNIPNYIRNNAPTTDGPATELVSAPWDGSKNVIKLVENTVTRFIRQCNDPMLGALNADCFYIPASKEGSAELNNILFKTDTAYRIESGYYFGNGYNTSAIRDRFTLFTIGAVESINFFGNKGEWNPISIVLRPNGLFIRNYYYLNQQSNETWIKLQDSVTANQYIRYAVEFKIPSKNKAGTGYIKTFVNGAVVDSSVNIGSSYTEFDNLKLNYYAANSKLGGETNIVYIDDFDIKGEQPTTRDAFQLPFDTYSIWNTPLGDQANYQPASMNTDPYKNFVESGEPIRAFGLGPEREYVYQATASDSVVSVYRDDKAYDGPLNRCRPTVPSQNPFFGDEVNLRINANDLIPQNNRNNVTSVYDQTTGKLKEYNGTCRNVVGGPVTASDAYSGADPGQPDMRIKGPGLYGGHGGTTMSGLGGTIRKGELSGSTPIRHALKMTVQGGHYLYETNPGWRWPATQADGYAYNQNDSQHYRGKNPKYKIGSLLAIPPSVDISTFQLSEPVYKIAWALQNYGVYVVDDSVCNCVNLAMQADGSSSGANSVESEIQTLLPGSVDTAGGVFASSGRFYTDMAKLFPLLQIVDNNTPSTIGGPGIRRQPWLPTLP
jgi:hypothetical protein